MVNNLEREDTLLSSQRLLLALKEARTKLEAAERAKTEPIAIIGMGCRFPGGSDNPEAFWTLLGNGVDAITEVPTNRWDINAFYDPDPVTPGKMYTRLGGFIDQLDEFDPHFFGISPRETVSIDPQQRLLLEVSWEALENSGLVPEQLAGSKTGVFIGICGNDYFQLLLNRGYTELDLHLATGNAYSVASGRLSYLLGLKGPSLSLDTACSSSLVSVHLACQSLRNRESDLALAGGVNMLISPERSIILSKARMLSPDSLCKTFDAAANGFVRSEGCGVVVLKRLSDAVADKDNILAVIRGSAINQDGRTSGLCVPNGLSQQGVISQALENSGVKPAQVSYVEAHGTGTSLGDPIEIEALAAVYSKGRTQDQPLVIGSVKTNIGHLEAGAGVAGLIKVVLSLQHEEIPSHLHFKQPNPHLNWDKLPLPLIIPTQPIPWSSGEKRRIAGVSSFGFSGTNAHVVVEEAPSSEVVKAEVERPYHLLTLSAKTEEALQQLSRRYRDYLITNPTSPLEDICFTANTGRSHFAHRLTVITKSKVELGEQLSAIVAGKEAAFLASGVVQGQNTSKLAFLFTGQGCQYAGMGRQLYGTQPTFRQTLDLCDEILRPYLEQPLLKVLYPATEECSLLDQTAYTQPALFALEYALAQLWKSWGITPDVVMGHSVGEYVAACVAGAFSLEDGLKLIVERSRLMQSLPQNGEMAVVFAPSERVMSVVARYQTQVAIAAVNGPENVVISGERGAVAAVLEQLKSEEIAVKSLNVSHAFHSPLMMPILDAFEQSTAQVNFAPLQISLISNLTGKMLKPGEILDGSYWRRHIRETVQFDRGMHTLAEQGYDLFVELGPQPTLLGMGKRCLPIGSSTWLASLKKDQDDWQMILDSLSALYLKGIHVDWVGFDRDYPRCRISLPTYPWQRQRYWLEESSGSPRTPRSPQRIHQEVDVVPEETSLEGEGRLTRDILLAAESGERQRLLESYLSELLARVLRVTASQLDLHQPLNNQGLDSLMAVELKNLIETDLGLVVPLINFLQDKTVAQMATQILEPLETAIVDRALPIINNQSQEKVNQLDLINIDDTELLLANLSQLSEDEVNSLLSSMLTEKGLVS